ncbi:MAG: VOC family protein [Acidimicrobiales bacterium]
MELGRFRVGLRVEDVPAAAEFYRGLGFEDVGEVPAPDGSIVMVMLQRDGAMLIVDALEGMPFPEGERERQVKEGPRGLGVAIGLGVDDLDTAISYCSAAGCTITSEPREEPYGDRVFECIDPFGYVWEMSQPITDVSVEVATAATRDEWFGPNT